MSYHTGFSLFVFPRRDPKADLTLSEITRDYVPGANTSPAEPQPSEFAALRKEFFGQTRSNWLKEKFKILLDVAGGLEVLRFLSEEAFTHREFCTFDGLDKPLQDNSSGYDYQHMVIAPGAYLEVVEAIDWLFLWCKNNIIQAASCVDDAEENVLDSLYRTIISADDKDLKADEGQGAQFLFCVLKCVRNLLLYAHQHRLCVIYSNDQYIHFSDWKDLTPLADGSRRVDGSLYVNPDYKTPPLANRPMLLEPPRGLPIDVPARLEALTPAEREQAKMIPPTWAKTDDMAYLFEQEDTLLATGRVVWGALIQANGRLFQPAYTLGGGGEVLYDPEGRMSFQGLVDMAHFLFEMKDRQREAPDEQFIADYLADELTRVFGHDVPRQWCCYPLKISSTYFDQLHLPDGMLTLPFFPILISEQSPGAVELLPCQFWPEVLTQDWLRACEHKHGQRYEASQLRAQAQARAQAWQAASPPPSTTPLDMNGPASLYEQGLLFFHGRGVPQDLGKARLLWERAAEQGHLESMNNLGAIYGDGLGVKADFKTGFNWYRRAAQQGFALGQVNLGKMYLRDDGPTPPDPVKAKLWLDKAAAQGNAEAKQLLEEFGLTDRATKKGSGLGRLWKKWFH